jgi:monomeric isocitrate dehydrogenase
MQHVPLVVAGSAVLDPYEGYEARVLDRDGDVVRACEEVAAAEMPRHSRVASDSVQTGARASVTRRRGSLLVSVSGLDDLEPRRREAAVVRMLAKLREFDTTARGIDIVLTSPT